MEEQYVQTQCLIDGFFLTLVFPAGCESRVQLYLNGLDYTVYNNTYEYDRIDGLHEKRKNAQTVDVNGMTDV